MSRAAAAVAATLVVTLCGCSTAPRPAESLARQSYRASITTSAGDEIPFLVELPANCNTDRAAIVNGKERLSVPCQRLGRQVLIDFLVYGTRISAETGNGGELVGHWAHTGGAFADDRRQFSARPIERLDGAARFAAPDQPSGTSVHVSATWRVTFDSGELAKAVIETAERDVVYASAEVPSEYGDLRFLAGNVHGRSLLLSTFDGATAYLVRGTVDADDRLRGELIRADGTRDAFTAERSADFDVVDPLQRVRVLSREKRLDLPQLRGPRYAGKAVIVELFGTWCSNCNDLAPLLAELYRTHRGRGLEIISLAYELSHDAGYTRERLAAYKAQHGIDWELLMPSGPPEELLAVGPATISPISGVPVTIFLNRDRTIRAIYTGFWGPATGTTHQRAVATFRQLVQDILE